MRLSLFLFAFAVTTIAGHAQNSVGFKGYEESTMVSRLGQNVDKARAANNAYYSGKKVKPDDSLKMEFAGKTFNSGGAQFDKKVSGQNKFLFDQKVTPTEHNTRSFLGIRNPWFGPKTYASEKASLYSKTEVANANKKFQTDSAEMRPFYQADKKAGDRSEVVVTGSTKVDGKAQGALDSISSQKTLTIDEVRRLLNKN